MRNYKQLTASCEECGQSFQYYKCNRLNPRYCCRACSTAARRKKAIVGKCAHDGCNRTAQHRSPAGELCHSCYSQFIRTGGTVRLPRRMQSQRKSGYITLTSPGHPLSHANGSVFEHRLVMWEVCHGECGECYWCNAALTWPNAVVDHLNERKNDNRPENLVFSCNTCNVLRGSILGFLHRVSPDRLNEALELARQYANRVHSGEEAAERVTTATARIAKQYRWRSQAEQYATTIAQGNDHPRGG